MTRTRCAAFLACLLATPRILPAQAIWISPLTSRAELGVEWTRPDFESNTGLGTFRGIWIASGRYRVGERGAVIVAVPRFVTSGSQSFGNPYVGYQSSLPDGNSSFSLGFRIPNVDAGFTPDQEMAFRGDFDRYEEMLPKYLTIHAEGQEKVWRDSAGADVRIRVGFTLFHPTEALSGNENSFFGDYGFRFGHRWPKVDLGLAVTGRWILSGNGGSVWDRNISQAAFDLGWHGRVEPRVAFRIPVSGNIKTLYKSAVTLGLTVPLP